MKLVRLPAPAYWSRWAVEGHGTIERRGGFSPWYALDLNSHLIATRCPNRAAAIAALTSPEED